MLNKLNSASSNACNTATVSIDEYYGSNTAEVVKVITSSHQLGQVKWKGGVVWRAIPSCNNVAFLVGQRVRILDRIQDSLLLVVEPIVLGVPKQSADEVPTRDRMPNALLASV
jgi:hypothetical protein